MSCDHDDARTTPSWTAGYCPRHASRRESACAAHLQAAPREHRRPSRGSASCGPSAAPGRSCGSHLGSVEVGDGGTAFLSCGLTRGSPLSLLDCTDGALGGLRAHRSHSFLLWGLTQKEISDSWPLSCRAIFRRSLVFSLIKKFIRLLGREVNYFHIWANYSLAGAIYSSRLCLNCWQFSPVRRIPRATERVFALPVSSILVFHCMPDSS